MTSGSPAWTPAATLTEVTSGISASSSPSDHAPSDSPTSALRSIRIAAILRREPCCAAEELRDAPRLPRTAARFERGLGLEQLRDRAGRVAVEGVERLGERDPGRVLAPHPGHRVQPGAEQPRPRRPLVVCRVAE